MIALKFGESGEGSLTKGEAELLLFFISAYVAAFAGSWGPLGWSDQVKFVLLRFDLQVKLSMLPWTCYSHLLLLKFSSTCFVTWRKLAQVFFFFAGFVLIMTVFIAFFLPETKNLPIEEISKVRKSHWFWTKFVPDVTTQSWTNVPIYNVRWCERTN